MHCARNWSSCVRATPPLSQTNPRFSPETPINGSTMVPCPPLQKRRALPQHGRNNQRAKRKRSKVTASKGEDRRTESSQTRAEDFIYRGLPKVGIGEVPDGRHPSPWEKWRMVPKIDLVKDEDVVVATKGSHNLFHHV